MGLEAMGLETMDLETMDLEAMEDITHHITTMVITLTTILIPIPMTGVEAEAEVLQGRLQETGLASLMAMGDQ